MRNLIGLSAAVALAPGCSQDEPKAEPLPTPAVAVAEPVEAAAPAQPAGQPADGTETGGQAGAQGGSASQADALKQALLGLNPKQAEPEEEPEPEPRRAPPRRATRASRTRSASNQAAQADEPMFAAVQTKPSLSDDQFQDTVNSWKQIGMRTCLASSSLRGRDRTGAMKVAFKIRGDGSVSDCEVIETSNAVAATIAPCVERSARRIRFPAFGGDETEKQAKFVF